MSPAPESPHQFFATAAKGTEGALRDELRAHRFQRVRATRGGVHFEGDLAAGMRACVELRIPLRVLLRVAGFDAPDPEALYEGVRAIDWAPWIHKEGTIAVRSAAKASNVFHTRFIAQRTKDGIVDQFRERHGIRPSVDTEKPDTGVFVHLERDRAEVFVDVSGAPLFQRGYRTDGGPAPLKETLAAAVLGLAGYDGDSDFLDPMCGSGTLAIEASLIAHRIAPGLTRKHFGFQRWPAFDRTLEAAYDSLVSEARARQRPDGPTILASDIDLDALTRARANAAQAGATVRFARRSIDHIQSAPRGGRLVCNPPYGERLELDERLYGELSALLDRTQADGAAILSGDPELRHAIRRRVHKALDLFNGALPCVLWLFDLSAKGSVSKKSRRPRRDGRGRAPDG